MQVIRGIYFWVMATLVTLLMFSMLAVAHGIAALRGQAADGRAAHSFAALWGKSLIFLMPKWSIEVQGRENLPADRQPMVIVANHESMSDIWGIYYLGVQFRWLSKDAVFKIPVVGQAMRWSNYVSVNRSDRQSGHLAMIESAKRLKNGVSMFFFPEGTRSLDGTIKPFKMGAFKLARDEQVPVLPVAIHGASAMLPKHSWIPGRARIQIRVLPPVAAPAKDCDIAQYAEDVRQSIIAAHGQFLKNSPG